MIKPNEYCKGNLVRYRGEYIVINTVDEVEMSKDSGFIEETDIDVPVSKGDGIETHLLINNFPAEDIEDIPLTDEIFIQAGFKKNEDALLIKDGIGFKGSAEEGYFIHHLKRLIKGGHMATNGPFGHDFEPISTLHELQNVYSYFSGWDLVINLK